MVMWTFQLDRVNLTSAEQKAAEECSPVAAVRLEPAVQVPAPEPEERLPSPRLQLLRQLLSSLRLLRRLSSAFPSPPQHPEAS
jgi:hypothetical protein